METKVAPKRVACPRCGKEIAWTPDNPYRPFCSQRCRQIDLGAWAAGKYRVPVIEQSPDADRDDSQGV